MRPASSHTPHEASRSPSHDPQPNSSSEQPKYEVPGSPRSPRSPRLRLWNTELHDASAKSTPQYARRTDSPVSSSSDSPFDQMSSSITDRVFPVRSAISVDPELTPRVRPEGYTGDGFPGMEISESASDSGIAKRRPQLNRHSTNSVPSFSNSSKYAENAPRTHRENEKPSGAQDSLSGEPTSSSRPLNNDPLDRVGGWQQMFSNRPPRVPESYGNVAEGATTSTSGSVRNMAEDTGGLLTARFKHVVTDGGHAVIIGRDGDALQRCEDEPIHIPGAVQSFGMLVALQEDDEGKLKVRIVSENSRKIIGYTPKQLFALDTFCDILSEEQTDNLLDHIDFIREDDADPATNGPEVFTLAIRPPTRKSQKMWCAMHVNENNRDLIICEFELEDDQVNPLFPAGEQTPEPPEDTLQSNPTPEEYAESTVNSSKPLRVLRSARKRKGETAAMEVFNIMSQVQEQLANAPDLETFLKVLVGIIKELTGFHRVMIYQFDQAWNGRVVTELVDPRATKDLYKGLNFPASDIPKQARDLYKVNKVRLLYDRDQETARLVCRTVEDLETPLDLTFAYLRAMSPIHIKYLANMAVRASMSISINAFNELWGLIACHSYGSKGMRVSFPIRKMCRLVGDSASRNIERLSYASRLQARKLINTVSTEKNPSGYIIASSEDLLKLFDADSGLLSIREETKILGKLEQTQEALAMLEYLRLRNITSVMESTDIQLDFPDLHYAPGFNIIAGLLLVPLSVGGKDFIVFFRKAQTREVKWAGNPYEKFIQAGTEGYLEPRKSFKTWSETLIGKCREWTEEQIETAAVLCLVYGKFIEVWRQKEVALQNSQLTKLLLANSAHEVRTPLNAIINYLEIALEGAIDQETRENLSKSHSASKSLIYVINDLLDLTKTEEGHHLVKDEIFDLPSTLREATDMFAGDVKRKKIEYEVIENPGIPQYVLGDQRRVRQAISNVIANAIQHTSTGGVKVELWVASRSENRADIDIIVQDTGEGMSAEKLDCLFRDLEQVQYESEAALPEEITSEPSSLMEPRDSKKTLGLGLALVARIVRNMNGQLRLKSEEGKGSRFVIQIGFDLPDNEESQCSLAGVGPPNQPSTPPVEVGEVMLVNKSAQKVHLSPSSRDLTRRMSNESTNSLKRTTSLKSFKTGTSARSDVDRLIDAIQEPHMIKHSGNSEKHEQSPGVGSGQWSGLSSGRPGRLSRSHSANRVPRTSVDLSTPRKTTIQDSKTPVRPVRMPNEVSQGSPTSGFRPRTPHRGSFTISDKVAELPRSPTSKNLHILIAEDDPINSKIVKKRLEKVGHIPYLTINGEECSSLYGDQPAIFDVVLMDMQVCIY